MSDTDFDLLSEPKRRRLIRFNPNVDMGTLIQLATILAIAAGGWGTYQSDKATAKLELEQVKKAAADDKSSTKETLTDLKVDVKEIQRTLIQVNQTLAVINANQPKGKP